MNTTNRRTDLTTTALITEALKFQRAFGKEAALAFLSMQGVDKALAERALSGIYDKRQRICV
ncbi:hypothetical protein GTP56_17305 [Duganella sp. FT134W]|uniref:Uncharacterized protein n=1 Tax=Duganella margarita TaxID=2692170 RepID=A0A7X4KIV9_9BURK|nr:hypothetical protein [Duganella margarita]MYM73943.1 hypothetical protein [Duganella margarita]